MLSCSFRFAYLILRSNVCDLNALGGHNHDILLSENLLTWTEAKSFCESENAALVIIRDDETNSQIHTSISPQEAWIGLSRPTPWIWSDTGENYTFTNWQSGQPDNLNGYEECSAMVVNNGTWTDEQCTKKYPFFCTGGMSQTFPLY